MTTNAVSAVQVQVKVAPGPLALNAPQIPTAVANGGLRWEDLDDPASPVLVQIVLVPGTIGRNDTVDLYWEEEPADSVTVNDDHLSAGVISLQVAAAAILEHPDGEHRFQYTVTAAIGGGTEPSPRMVTYVAA